MTEDGKITVGKVIPQSGTSKVHKVYKVGGQARSIASGLCAGGRHLLVRDTPPPPTDL